MSTVKLAGWTPQAPPTEGKDTAFHRQLLIEIVFGVYRQKKELLTKKGWPPQPVLLREIWLEFKSRRQQLISVQEWPIHANPKHTKRWTDRRINEAASEEFLKTTPKIVAVRAGAYKPNPELFGDGI